MKRLWETVKTVCWIFAARWNDDDELRERINQVRVMWGREPIPPG